MRAIVAEDDPVTGRLLEATLRKWGYEVVRARTGTEAQEAVLAGQARLIICDWMLPEVQGPDLCRHIRQSDGGGFVYFIMLSARDRKEDVIAGLEAGADDYLTKPFDAHELQVRVRAGQRVLDLQQDLLEAQEKLRHMAHHDGLTALWNHRMILDLLGREYSRHEREGRPLTVAMMDLDHFKRVNDAHGHPVGDAVLVEAARRIEASRRPYDSVGRYGGEEFLVILPGCSGEAAVGIAERFRLAVADKPIETSAGPISITLSGGVASTTDLPEAGPAQLVEGADAALYRAKQAGRDRVMRAGAEQGS